MKYHFVLIFACIEMGYGLCTDFLPSKNDADIVEELYLTTPELIKKYKYQVEIHHVTTDDGYILELHRITGSPNSSAAKRKHPVLLKHGLLDSSATWVLMRPSHGLGYLLADDGFDVWLGNSRGNRYSRNHTVLDPNADRQFWNFSWHEMGIFDLAATIDYILTLTKTEKLHFIGHSQGSTEFLVLCSERPEYNDRIIEANLLTLTADLNPTKNFIFNSLRPFSMALTQMTNIIGSSELSLSGELSAKFAQYVCTNALTNKFCENLLFSVLGKKSNQVDDKMIALVYGHIPAGSSMKTLVHLVQLINQDRFQQYDYGMNKNIMKYQSLSPPKYEVANVKVKVIIYYVENDGGILGKNIEEFIKQLPNVVACHFIPEHNFNHMDYILSKNVRQLIYDNLIEDLKSTDDTV